MSFVAKKGEIVVLEDNEAYQVVARAMCEENAYLLLIKVKTNVQDIFDESKRETQIVQEIVEDGEYFLSPVTDKNLVQKIYDMIKLNDE